MKRIVFAVGLFLLAALTVLRGADPLPVQTLRDFYFDYLQRLSPRQYQDLPVRVVDVDETSLARMGQWPWPRDQVAELVDRLFELGAAVVVFDVLFAEPDRLSPSRIVNRLSQMDVRVGGIGLDRLAEFNTDALFASSMRDRPVVLGVALAASANSGPPPAKAGFAEIGNQPALGLPRLDAASPLVADLYQAAGGIGSISVSPTGDANVIRRVPMVWRSDAGPIPGLSLESLRLAFGEQTIVLLGVPEIEGYLERIRIADLDIPTSPDGQLWVRYRKDHPDLYVSAQAVMDPGRHDEVLPRLEGNIVLIGTSAAGLIDIRTTALGETVPGVSIHAQIIEQILLGQYLLHDELVETFEIFTFVGLGLIVLVVMTWFGPLASMSAGAAVGAVVALGSWFAFTRYGILFDATFPLIGGFIAFSGVAAYQFIIADRDKRMIRRSFSHYVAPAILDQIETAGGNLGLGGVNRTVTVMFCDIRNFTPLSESVSAEDLVALLNELFTELGAQILAEGGTIDKFIGDAIMAFWNAPLESPEHRRDAARAALRMRGALGKFNNVPDRAPISTAIGLSSGVACVGNIGSRDRFNYSAVGDAVNVASRIETACRHVNYDILMTADTAEGAEEMALLYSGDLQLKGKSHRLHTFILVGDDELAGSPEFKELRALHDKAIADLASNGRLDKSRIDELAAAGLAVEPGLEAFYRRIAVRTDDFTAGSPA